MSESGIARRGRRSPKSTRSDAAPYVPCPGNVVSFVAGVRRAHAATRYLLLALFVTIFAVAPVLVQPAAGQTVTFPRGTLFIDTARGDARFEIEIARTEAERSRGLMYRGELAPDTGMLFLFDPVREANMWMRNTFIALDMLFIAPDGPHHRHRGQHDTAVGRGHLVGRAGARRARIGGGHRGAARHQAG